jgi:hypothetical protein
MYDWSCKILQLCALPHGLSGLQMCSVFSVQTAVCWKGADAQPDVLLPDDEAYAYGMLSQARYSVLHEACRPGWGHPVKRMYDTCCICCCSEDELARSKCVLHQDH